MDYTTNKNLAKPTENETYDLATVNENIDKIDAALKTNDDAIAQLNENSAYTPLTPLGTVDGIKLYYSKYGKNVMVKGEGNFSKAETITSSAQLKLGTLPVGSRPSTTLFYPLNYLYTNAWNLTLSILKDGTVSVCTTSSDISITSGKYFNFIVQFIQ